MLTIRQICDRSGLGESTLRTRLQAGQPLDRPYGVQPKRAWFCGEYLTRKQIAQRVGLSRKTIEDRIRRGKPLEDLRYAQRPRE
jgi:hypothetical protein